MPTRRVSVNQLRTGMYVSKLDVSWFRSPFLRHTFLIQTPEQIDKLIRVGVRTVEIDLNRGCNVLTVARATAPPKPEGSYRPPSAEEPLSSPPMSLAKSNGEFAQAKEARARLEQAVSSIFSTLREQGVVDRGRTTDTLDHVTAVTRTLPSSTVVMALSQNRNGDGFLGQHALTTCTLSLLLGGSFNFDPSELSEMATAAVLHDIGLLQIPSGIVRRFYSDSATLSSKDHLQMETHPRLGVIVLQRQGGFDDRVIEIMGEHHALLDGSGYPKGVCGAFTSVRTRIVMVADRYDELISGFGGTAPLLPQRALQQLYREAELGQLDAEIVSRLITLVGVFPVHSEVRLNTGERAVVTELNPGLLHHPVVAITHGPEGLEYAPPLVVDLTRQNEEDPERFIESIIEAPLPHLRAPSV